MINLDHYMNYAEFVYPGFMQVHALMSELFLTLLRNQKTKRRTMNQCCVRSLHEERGLHFCITDAKL
jgi:hypothetical protein